MRFTAKLLSCQLHFRVYGSSLGSKTWLVSLGTKPQLVLGNWLNYWFVVCVSEKLLANLLLEPLPVQYVFILILEGTNRFLFLFFLSFSFYSFLRNWVSPSHLHPILNLLPPCNKSNVLSTLKSLKWVCSCLMQVHVQSDPAGRLIISGEPEQPDNPWGVTPFKKVGFCSFCLCPVISTCSTFLIKEMNFFCRLLPCPRALIHIKHLQWLPFMVSCLYVYPLSSLIYSSQEFAFLLPKFAGFLTYKCW